MNIPIFCVICEQEVNENEYANHMARKHPRGQLAGVQAKKNLPPTQKLPPGISPADLPSAEFMETIKEMEMAASSPPPPKPPVAQPNVKITPPRTEPVTLTYKYTGNCKCGNSVATLEMDVENKHFVIAYCLFEKKQIESREVANLTPSVVENPSPLLPKAQVNEKPPKGLTEGVQKKAVKE